MNNTWCGIAAQEKLIKQTIHLSPKFNIVCWALFGISIFWLKTITLLLFISMSITTGQFFLETVSHWQRLISSTKAHLFKRVHWVRNIKQRTTKSCGNGNAVSSAGLRYQLKALLLLPGLKVYAIQMLVSIKWPIHRCHL